MMLDDLAEYMEIIKKVETRAVGGVSELVLIYPASLERVKKPRGR